MSKRRRKTARQKHRSRRLNGTQLAEIAAHTPIPVPMDGRWVIEKTEGLQVTLDKSPTMRNATGGLIYYWRSEADARISLSQMPSTSQKKRTIRRLYQSEFDAIGEDGFLLVDPKRREEDLMVKKVTSVGSLVDVFEDFPGDLGIPQSASQ